MRDAFYTSPPWVALRERVLTRDNGRCTVARLLGGKCRGVLHVHHLIPRADRPDLALDEENLITTCAAHHPTLEALRRFVERRNQRLGPCGHVHRYREGREACMRQRARALGLDLDEQLDLAVA